MLSDSNFDPMGLQEYSLTFGAVISKTARHRLCVLCLAEIEKDLIGASESNSPKGRGRGRPQSPATVLAIQIGVSYDAVSRWRDPEAIQSCDVNAVKLAEVAYGYDAPTTVKILEEDIELHREAVEDWISQRTPLAHIDTPNSTVSPCVENTEVKEGS